MSVEGWLGAPWVQPLGWALVQFLWQGTVIALLFAGARALLRRSLSAPGRYVMACATLVLMVLAPVLTLANGTRVANVSTTSWLLQATAAWEPAMPWIVGGWFLGVVVCSLRLLGGWAVTSRLRSSARSAPPDWEQAFERLAARLRIARHVGLRVSARVDTPVVVGWLRPLVLVPVGALTGLPAPYVMALLAHELAHVRRGDYLANLLQRIAESVLFYHPAIWWVSNQIRAEREMCCDDIAIAVDDDPLTYASALTALEACRVSPQPVLGANGPSLVDRIRRILGHAVPLAHLLPGPSVLAAIATASWVGVAAVAANGERAAWPELAGPLVEVGRTSEIPSRLLTAALLGPIGPAQAAPSGAIRFGHLDPPPQAPTPVGPATIAATSTVRGVVRRQDTGLPLANATVRLNGVFAGNIRDRVPDPPAVTTDLQGRFEITDVRPGEYHLSAIKSGFVETEFGRRGVNGPPRAITVSGGLPISEVDVALPVGGVITGQVLDQSGDPLSGIRVQALWAQRFPDGLRPGGGTAMSDVTDDRGRFRLFGLATGSYFLGAALQGTTADGALAFYPGTYRAREAQAVHVEAGGETPPIAFTFVRPTRVELTGRVTGSDGMPVTAGTVAIRPDGTLRDFSGITATIANGTFAGGLAPGEYVVTAHSADRGETTTERVSLDGGPAAVSLTLQRPARLRGRIVLDSASPRPSIRPSDIMLGLGDEGGPPRFGGVEIRDDGTFEVGDLVGRKEFGYAPPPGWRMKGVRRNGRAVEEPLEFNGADLDDVQVIFTDRLTRIRGRVTDERNRAAAGVVLAFADDRSRWHEHSGYVDTSAVDADGGYEIEGLPAARYLVVALDALGPIGPSLFEALRGRAIAVTLGDAEQKTVNLRVQRDRTLRP